MDATTNFYETKRLVDTPGYLNCYFFMFRNSNTVKRFYKSTDAEEFKPIVKNFSESFYRDCLANSINGKTEVKTPVGAIDVLSDSELIEVKDIKSWKGALGQVLAYAHFYPTHLKRLHLYGKTTPDLTTIKQICTHFNVEVSFVLAEKGVVNKEELEPLTRKEMVDFMEVVLTEFWKQETELGKNFFINFFNKVSDVYMDSLSLEELEKFNRYLLHLSQNPTERFEAKKLNEPNLKIV